MKRKLTIAIVAILAISIVLAGCTTATAPISGAVSESYAGNGRANAPADSIETGTGYRGGNGNGNTGIGYSDACDPVYDGTQTADPNYTLSAADQTLSLSGYGSEGALGDEQLTLADMLTYAIQDEYLARAEYDRIMSENGTIRPFSNILRAEETHIDALLPLFDIYGIAAPADEGESRTASVANLTEAYQAGVNAEVNNIAMYETFLDQDLPSDVRTVFESLMHASENHLRAFQNQL